MGVYLNPGNDAFAMAVRDDIYVDKTELIVRTNHRIGKRNRYICISRPRRFGKSMAAEMLAAYYGRDCDSSELFKPYKIAQHEDYETHLNQYNVIFINVQDAFSRMQTISEALQYIQKSILEELKEEYGEWIPADEIFLSMALEKLYSRKKEKFIFIFDEWDCVFRIEKRNTDAQKRYLDFLRELLKDKVYVSLAYMTGILPVKKYGVHSALNMFAEYSMTDPAEYAEYIGFTGDEVRDLCRQYQIDFVQEKEWYDGYLYKENLHIYNPKSVVDSILRKRFASYWTRTETYEALKIYIDLNLDGLKDAVARMMAGERVVINTERFQNDMTTFESRDDVLTLLVHLGYLAFDCEESEVFIPNMEILGEFRNAAGWHRDKGEDKIWVKYMIN